MRFPAGPAFARLAAADAPWPAVLEPSEKAEVSVSRLHARQSNARPSAIRSGTSRSRTPSSIARTHPRFPARSTFAPAAPGDLYFRAAADQDLKPGKDEATFLLPRGLTISVEGGTLRAAGDLTELIVPLVSKKNR
ncbi:MAG: hypothetical protein R3F11_23490 [Verrucomicrobiales bacterium]